MPYLIESNEWRLLQGLGLLLSQRKARYQVQSSPPNHPRGGGHFIAERLEVALRQVFLVKEYPQNLEPPVFEQCQMHLSGMCSLLDDLTPPQFAKNSHNGQTYPRLRALTGILETTSGAVDLVTGPNVPIFTLPRDALELGRCLDAATECNNVLSRLLEPPPQEPAIPSEPKQKSKTAWKKARIRNRATFVLGKLFEHFRCETSHEVLLKLIEDSDEHSTLPDLQLMLSPCRQLKLELWQEARCDSTNLSETAISSIRDICADLQQHAGQGKALMLLIEKYGLFGAWAGTNGSALGPGQSRQSLDQLILKGAFKPLDLNTLFNGAPPATFDAQDKRTLAVKLGYCLMDFFDADVSSNRIYFLDSSNPGVNKDFPYLAFGSRVPVTADAYNNFEVGHPTLLSFAKLLLEIDFGQSINLDIKPQNSQNRGVWVELLTRVDLLAQERNDSYLQAIRGCLVVHEKIAKALRSRKIKSQDAADATVRKKLYKEVIRKLERGLAQSIPRPSHKRQRSESPTPSSTSDMTQAIGLGKMAIRSMMPKHGAPGYKRRRLPGMERSPSPTISNSSRGEASSFSRRSPSVEENSDSCSISGRLSKWHKPSRLTQSPSVAPGSFSRSPQRPLRREDFEIAIICALPLEYNAVTYLFDEFWDDNGDQYGRAPGDRNSYTPGRMGNYNVVLALVHMGKVNAAGAAATMRASYTNLRLALLVGVCGAAPYSHNGEILLGDVIISKTVVQHDFGRQYSDKFVRKETTEDSLGRPNKDIRNLIAIFETDRGIDLLEDRTAYFVQQLQDEAARRKRPGKYNHPGIANDKLFKTQYRHKHYTSGACDCCKYTGNADPVCDEALDSSCADLGCDERHLVARDRLKAIDQRFEYDGSRSTTSPPVVHVGAVASGDSVIKSAADRDRISEEVGVIGFEMEGAGIWDEVPSIVVKGVCDYADSHKNKAWQDFAAATAASACKAILERYIRTDKTVHAPFENSPNGNWI